MKRVVAVVLALAIGGCEGLQEQAQEVGGSLVDLTAGEIGGLAARIFDDPSQAETILEASGISLARLDSIVYDIATDAEASAEYLRGLEQADR